MQVNLYTFGKFTVFLADCCVKVYVLQNGKRIAKKKTSYKHEEISPVFNEAMIFSLPQNRTEVYLFNFLCFFACLSYQLYGAVIFADRCINDVIS